MTFFKNGKAAKKAVEALKATPTRRKNAVAKTILREKLQLKTDLKRKAAKHKR